MLEKINVWSTTITPVYELAIQLIYMTSNVYIGTIKKHINLN
jgi:hypothetical protein